MVIKFTIPKAEDFSQVSSKLEKNSMWIQKILQKANYDYDDRPFCTLSKMRCNQKNQGLMKKLHSKFFKLL